MNVKVLSLSAIILCTGLASQTHATKPIPPAKDTLKSLVNESTELEKKEKVLFEKIIDTTRDDGQELRCVEMPKIMEQRISINERSMPLMKKEHAKQLGEQNKIIKEKLAQAKVEFGC